MVMEPSWELMARQLPWAVLVRAWSELHALRCVRGREVGAEGGSKGRHGHG